jgi:hypothetical protein
VSKHSSAFFSAGGRRIPHTYIAATGRTVRNRASSAVVVVVARGLAEKRVFLPVEKRGKRRIGAAESEKPPPNVCSWECYP